MQQEPVPAARLNLSDDLAHRLGRLIQTGAYQPGDRLPSVARMSRDLGSHPALREALSKLATLGLGQIRHGSGVYVGKDRDPLVVTDFDL